MTDLNVTSLAVRTESLKSFATPLRQLLPRLVRTPIVIVGDVGLDEYTFGHVRRISPEAPVPVLEVERQEYRLGLAANVAQNVASLSGEARLISVVGPDAEAVRIRELLLQAGVTRIDLIEDPSRPTTRKSRILSGNHHIVRVDFEQRQSVSTTVESGVIAAMERAVPGSAAIIIQDYAKGLISRRVVESAQSFAAKAGIPCLVDPHRTSPLTLYAGTTLMTPNLEEAFRLAMKDDPGDLSAAELSDRLTAVGQVLMREIGSRRMVITRGRDGMRVFDETGITDLPTNARQVFDVTGAGDTVIAALALALGKGASLVEACALANFAAGVVVAKVGSASCSVRELEDALAGT